MQASPWKFSALSRITNKKHWKTVCTCDYCMSCYDQAAKQKHKLELDSFGNKRNGSANRYVCHVLLFSKWKLMGCKNSFVRLIQVSLPTQDSLIVQELQLRAPWTLLPPKPDQPHAWGMGKLTQNCQQLHLPCKIPWEYCWTIWIHDIF